MQKKATIKVSFIVEWANTTYNGVPRFFGFLDIFTRQWRELTESVFPENINREGREFLQRIDPKPEFLLISGENIDEALASEIKEHCSSVFSPEVMGRHFRL